MTDLRWVKFYESFADRLLTYAARPATLFASLRSLADREPLMAYLRLNEDARWPGDEIDPFTVMAIFNRGISAPHRHMLALALAGCMGLENAEPPAVFHGIPFLDPRHSIFAGTRVLWRLFACAMSGHRQNLAEAFDAAIQTKGNGLASLSMGLYWCRPSLFMPVDKLSIPFIKASFGIVCPSEKCSGQTYLDFLERLQKTTAESFPQIAHSAWEAAHGAKA